MVEKLREGGYKIMEEKFSTTTRENLQNLGIILKKLEEKGYEIKELRVVTDYLHSVRARMIEGRSINGIDLKYVNVGNYTKKLIYDALTTFIILYVCFFDQYNFVQRELCMYPNLFI
jgi:hypothetical protein